MAILYDTNAILFTVRDKTGQNQALFNPSGVAEFVSIVTLAELESLAYRNGWGKPRLTDLYGLLSKVTVLDISDPGLVYYYVQIDAYSQGKHKTKTLSQTARNMGKNDLWIAATAAFHSFRLITTDKDFDHLNQVFVKVSYYDPGLLFR